jgi:hypothetical protein
MKIISILYHLSNRCPSPPDRREEGPSPLDPLCDPDVRRMSKRERADLPFMQPSEITRVQKAAAASRARFGEKRGRTL